MFPFGGGSKTRKASAGAWNTDWLVELAKTRGDVPKSAKPAPDPPSPPTPPSGATAQNDDNDPWTDDESDPDRDNAGSASGGQSRGATYPSWSTSHSSQDPGPPLSLQLPFGSASSNNGDESQLASKGGGASSSNAKPRGKYKPTTSHPGRNTKKGKAKGRRSQRKAREPPASGSGDVDVTSSELAKLQGELQDTRNELSDYKQMISILSSANDDLITHRNLLQTQLTDLHEIIESNDSKVSSLREQLDQAHFKLRKAERRNRYVDDSDRWKADAKYRKKQKDTTTLLFGFPSYEPDQARDDILKERRGAQGLVAKSVTLVTGMMNKFNEELFQTAASCSDLIENLGFEKASMSTASRERAERVLGARLVSMIFPTIPRNSLLNPIVVQITIQTFLVYWCNSIIEAWYPKQATFAEFLVDVASKLRVGSNDNVCGSKTMITQKHTRDSANLFSDWVEDIIDDLSEVLSIFGWKIRGYNPSSSGQKLTSLPIHARILSLVKEAYDIRTAMAEISTSGDVDLVIVSCDTPFNQELMEDAYGDRRTTFRKALVDDGMKGTFECVVGTTGIGLQREVLKPHELPELISRDIEMVLKPRVVLEYTLLEAFQ